MARLADRTSRIASSATMAVGAMVDKLRRSGVEVLDSRADQVAARAIERYLDLKRRNRL